MYSSVGHGGASGYLAILSLTSFALMEDDWLKQHAWSLNLIVAGLAFYRFNKAGHHIPSLSVPFILGGFPMAFVGGFLQVNEGIYDSLLSVVLILAGLRLIFSMDEGEHGSFQWSFLGCVAVGALIGLVSGVVGIGGGVLLSPLLIILHVGRPKGSSCNICAFHLDKFSRWYDWVHGFRRHIAGLGHSFPVFIGGSNRGAVGLEIRIFNSL